MGLCVTVSGVEGPLQEAQNKPPISREPLWNHAASVAVSQQIPGMEYCLTHSSARIQVTGVGHMLFAASALLVMQGTNTAAHGAGVHVHVGVDAVVEDGSLSVSVNVGVGVGAVASVGGRVHVVEGGAGHAEVLRRCSVAQSISSVLYRHIRSEVRWEVHTVAENRADSSGEGYTGWVVAITTFRQVPQRAYVLSLAAGNRAVEAIQNGLKAVGCCWVSGIGGPTVVVQRLVESLVV